MEPTEQDPPGLAPAQDGFDDPELCRRVDTAIELLESLRDDRAQLASIDEERRARLLQAAGRVARPDPWEKRELMRATRRRRQAERRAADERVLSQAGIREKRREAVFTTPLKHRTAPVLAGADIDRVLAADAVQSSALPAPELEPERADAIEAIGVVREPRACYVCKTRYRELHFFYDSLCQRCGDFNYDKRSQTADLSGRVALITGARVKIGYQAGIMLLRAGAQVVVTTRFAHDAAARYAREEDFEEWGHRLQVHGLDLRHTPSVEAFARHMNETLPRLDFILNNACQTVRRPSGFYRHLLAAEEAAVADLPQRERRLLEHHESIRSGARVKQLAGHDPAALSQLALVDEDLERCAQLFPPEQLDADLQQIDLRVQNSWRLPLADVPTVELLEVQLVNAVAPFILNARLKPLMLRQPGRDKHVVNVSAMEGQFYRSFKTDKHPHTNMAKAALNMMTRTSASDYVKDGIHMNSVDTGWVTDEDVAVIAARKTREHGFHPPLDIVDGAARICDPIFSGINSGKHVWGAFLKDYVPTDW